MRFIGGMAVGVGVAIGLAGVARADVLCTKKSGAAFVRAGTTCKKKETLVNPTALGLQGPKGDKGDPGTPGTPGTNGTAVAYAHVKGDGTVDATNSKNITSANVSKQATSAYCFHDLGFTFKNAIAVFDYADSGTLPNTATFALGDPFGDCSGQTGTVAEVATSDGSGFAPHAFFIIFN